MERNYAPYGIDLTFVGSDELTGAELVNVTAYGQTEDGPAVATVTPDGLNQFELGGIENEYYDGDARLHVSWGTTLANDEPKTLIDEETNYSSSAGLAWHVGSPDAPAVLSGVEAVSDAGVRVLTRGPKRRFPRPVAERVVAVDVGDRRHDAEADRVLGPDVGRVPRIGIVGFRWLDRDPILIVISIYPSPRYIYDIVRFLMLIGVWWLYFIREPTFGLVSMRSDIYTHEVASSAQKHFACGARNAPLYS